MRTKTQDRMTYYTTERLGKTREVTPEGFLLCKDVAIARTGSQTYLDSEIPLEANADGQIIIDRPPEEVFRQETIASFEGKPVTVEHPDEFVSPDNWQKLSVGVVQNVRRGEGAETDLLIADLLITASDAIEYANKELPELSAGYEADYEQTVPGRGVQRNIIGNHVALVDRGRAGPRCSIQDKEPTMKKKRNVWDRLMTAIKAKDAAAIEAELEEAKATDSNDPDAIDPDEKVKDNAGNGSVEERLAKIEDALTALSAGKKTDDEDEEAAKAKKDAETDDSDEEEEEETTDTIIEAEQGRKDGDPEGTVLTGDSLMMIKARAEVLAPGIPMLTADSDKRSGAVATFKRNALATAMRSTEGAACIKPFLGSAKTVDALRGAALDAAFIGASELMRERNNAKGARSGVTTRDFGRAVTGADINARNKAFWANRK